MADGRVFETQVQVVKVYDGRRGPKGEPGDQGEPGPKGDSYTLKGNWIKAQTYCPLDGVISRSTLVAGINSLFIQKSSVSCGPSNTPPYLDPSRWSEVGYKSWGDAFGAMWQVIQPDHGFTMIGQPVGYSAVPNRYVLADPRNLDTIGIALVREVIDKDRVVLQSTGMIPNINPKVIWPGNSTWKPGAVYYVGEGMGTLSLDQPSDATAFVNPILKVAQVISGVQSGIALPWAPLAQKGFDFRLLANAKFYFNGPGSVISGPDLYNNVLKYYPGDATDVFINGVNLWPTQYTAGDGTTIHFTVPLLAGDKVEVWTPQAPPDVLVRATTLKIDNLEDQFDGIATQFHLTYGGDGVIMQEVTSVQIYLDVHPQEPDYDFSLIPVSGGFVDIAFFVAPLPGMRFWGVALSPAGEGGLPPGGAAGALLAKKTSGNGDVEWIELLSGGTF